MKNKKFKKLFSAMLSMGLVSVPLASSSVLPCSATSMYNERLRYTEDTMHIIDKVGGNDEYRRDEVKQILIGKAGAELWNDISSMLKNGGKNYLILLGLSMTLANSTKTLSFINSVYTSCKNNILKGWHRLTHRGININNYEKTLAKIETRLKNELVGQDAAIDKIIKILRGYFESIKEARFLGKKYEGGLFLYFTGLPATGKSTAMKIIKEEFGLDAHVVLMSNIVDNYKKDTTSIASLLTKPILEDDGKNKVLVDTPFMRQVNSGLPTMFGFDEIEKYRRFETILQHKGLVNDDGTIYGCSVDEILRNFLDTGLICGKDVSGSVVIATSNESDDDFDKLEESLKNRYEPYRVKFADLTADDYKEIINRKSANLVEYYEKSLNLGVSWSPKALSYYGKKYETEKSGGRGVDSLIKEATSVLKDFVDKNNSKKVGGLRLDVDSLGKLKVVSDKDFYSEMWGS